MKLHHVAQQWSYAIEANYISQFDMLWRIILYEYPLGMEYRIMPAATIYVNLVDYEGHGGPVVKYDPDEQYYRWIIYFVHIYGKRR